MRVGATIPSELGREQCYEVNEKIVIRKGVMKCLTLELAILFVSVYF